jgi:hypothetical protein
MRAVLAMRFWQKDDANPGTLAVATLLSSSGRCREERRSARAHPRSLNCWSMANFGSFRAV